MRRWRRKFGAMRRNLISGLDLQAVDVIVISGIG